MHDSLGDRMKFYETLNFPQKLMPNIPVLARLDGKNFHYITRDLKRPYDENFSKCMRLLTRMLVQETNATIGYTQSDEITLSWYTTDYKSEIWFNGKPQKMISILSAIASVEFSYIASFQLPEIVKYKPLFDARVWTVPNLIEATNVFVWREQDATRNSIQMSARTYFSHKECQNKSCPELQEMLFKKHGINWNDYPTFFKRGTYIGNYKADTGERFVGELDLPVITQIENRSQVLYFRDKIILKEDKNES